MTAIQVGYWQCKWELAQAEIERLLARVAELEQRPTDEEIKEAMRRALEQKP